MPRRCQKSDNFQFNRGNKQTHKNYERKQTPRCSDCHLSIGNGLWSSDTRMVGVVFHGATTSNDTAQACGIIEWQLKGPVRNDIAIDSACVTLDIRNQKWRGYYKGDGHYVVRHSTYYTGTLSYTITSTIEGFTPIIGEITVENTWDVKPHDTDYIVGPQWWTDNYAPDDYWKNNAGARNQFIVREEIMADWAERWSWLKE